MFASFCILLISVYIYIIVGGIKIPPRNANNSNFILFIYIMTVNR